MMPSELFSFASQRGIRLWIENSKLRYHAPKGALTPELRKMLTEHRDSIIVYLAGESGRTSDTYPLSYNQQFLWFLYHLAPQSSAYNVAFVARVVSPVDISRMEAAFQKLVDRHSMLRTTYDSRGGVPFMRIHSRLDLAIEHIDATGWNEEALDRVVKQRYCEPFDLMKGPILRVQLFTCAPEDHVLLLTIHHIACDGQSIGILLKEFRNFYSIDPAMNLPLASKPYTNFIQYQSEMLEGREGERIWSFWKNQLAGELSELNLPVDKQRPSTRVPCGGTHHFSIMGDLYQKMVFLARSSGATLYTLLLASFQILLMRYSSQEDILIGTPMASRSRKEDEFTVGCFINPIVLRGDISEDITFKMLLNRTRKVFTDAFEHRHYPFPLLVEQLSPSRDPSRSPIFQAMFNLLNPQTLGEAANLLYRDKSEALAGKSVDFGNLKMRPFPLDQEEGQFDLALEMIDNNHSLTGLLKYSMDLFEEATIARMAIHFEILLQGIVMNPSRRLYDLPLLHESERHTLLCEWNQTTADYPQHDCLHTLFENQVEKTPDAVAVVFEDTSLTYREFDVRANRLAHHLRSLGVGPEVLVGVHLERSLDRVIALYAILKAGGAYVPLDPDYPRERLAFMIEEMKTPVILTQQRLKDKLPPHSAKKLYLDTSDAAWTRADRRVDNTPNSGVQPDNLAYVIYTSGSTGKPKGVMNTHRGICNRLLWMQETFQLTAEDVVLQKTPFCFDVSVWEFFWPLLSGARLVVARPNGHRDSTYLAKAIVEHGVTTIHFVPSMLQLFLENNEVGVCNSLKRVICSGEVLSYELQEHFFSLLDAELHNLYGPTEAAVDVTWWACRKGDERRIVPIGKPIANTQIYILDSHMQPRPIGVAGILYIGGVQVARGYLNSPELTSERFIPDPFRDEVGARLYKTGDLCRHLPDGNVEYLGRNDFQVKIRGMRIELGEIESNMRQFPGVREAIVTVREGMPGDKRLFGYLVPALSSEINMDQFRSFLKARLADYMVPASFMKLGAFPLTHSGKVDRLALPMPDGKRQTEGVLVVPRGGVEHRIVQIWRDLLRLEAVGLDDNFFDLGGHSILLVQMVARLQDEFQKDVSVLDLFKYPTVQEQAKLLRREESVDTSFQYAQTQGIRQRHPHKRRALSQNAVGSPMNVSAEVPEGIAVIGMDCRFPGATSVDRFWEKLRQGVESIQRFTDEELAAMGVPSEIYNAPNYVKAAPMIDDYDMFDAAFFGYAPREAEIIDPQHRVFLECAWSALENAGCDPCSYRGAIGVFGGAGPNYYGGSIPAPSEKNSVAEIYQRELGNEKDYLATRVSYKLNLKGPSLTVQTACSTSLVAVHVACQNLWTYQCDVALAGGVSINAQMKGGYFYQEEMISSPDGHCRAFDAKAQGTVVGQGAGIVVLKRLSDALADGDTIHAVIRGSAINNDGASRVGFTAPGVDGQADVITAAQAMAGVSPEDISYIEAHGTGTPLGDPIEIKALAKVFRLATAKRGFCAIGSVKTNFGHLDAAAGVASLIKTVLMLENKEIPPSLHFENPNPNLDLDNTPFFINTQLREWQSGGTPLVAGVSSFGLGGTNAHIVLEEAPLLKASSQTKTKHLLLFSAKTVEALDTASINLLSHLKLNPDLNISDVAFTLQVGRKAFKCRRTVVCSDLDDAIRALDSSDPTLIASSVCEIGHRDIVFMFSGQGSQYVNMCLDLYRYEPVFQQQIDRCSEILQRELSLDLRDLLFPKQERADDAEEKLKQTSITQPALFAVEYALAKLWMTWGIHPQALVGHSVGEYTAACLAEVFSMEDALKLVAARGRLMQEMPPGSMLAVFLSEADLAPFINDDLSLAAINGPSLCVVSGENSAVKRLESLLSKKQVGCLRLHTSHAFHSKMMDPVLAPFTERVKQAGPRPPKIPFLSNVTGTWITREEATDPYYWAKHCRLTNKFSDNIQELFKEPNRILLEVGPGRTLSVLANQNPAKHKGQIVLSSTRHPKEQQSDVSFILDTLGTLWRAGAPIDWAGFHADEKRRRIPLPTYPFKRKKYWIEAGLPPENKFLLSRSSKEAEGRSSDDQSKVPEADSVRSSRIDLGRNYVAPRTVTEKVLVKLWQNLLGIRDLGIDDDFFELEGHSLVAVMILSKVKKEFGMDIPLASFIQAPTIRQFTELLGETESKLSWPSLVALNAFGSKPSLFLMHSHGGNVLEYYSLAHHLGKDRPVYALQAKGLDGSLIDEPKVEKMAARYLKEIKAVQPRGPYYLGGFCFGGLLALEVAQQLLAEKERVALLTLINSNTKDYPRYSPAAIRFRYLYALRYRLALEWSGLKGKSLRKAIAHLMVRSRRVEDVIHVKVERLFDSLPTNWRGPFREHSVIYLRERLQKAHDQAWQVYNPKPYAGKVLFFSAKRQPPGIHPDPLLGWEDLLTGEVQLHVVPGFRQNMLDEPNVQSLALVLTSELNLLESKSREFARVDSVLNSCRMDWRL